MTTTHIAFVYNLDLVAETPFFDGLDAAAALVRDAHRLAVLYTGGCKGCVGALLGVLFDLAMEQQPSIGKTYTDAFQLPRDAYPSIPDDDWEAAIDRHRRQLQPKLQALFDAAAARGAAVHGHAWAA